MSSATPNRLAGESSAYLQAHANDPVAWRPWNAKTLSHARKIGKPILLSIGYQSCHWCHVMQRESFRDTDTARTINGGFVPVKVDREMRPDVDALYMAYVQASTGSGGWPLTVFLSPDGLPLYGGTYFPYQGITDRMPSLRQVMSSVHRSWKLAREDTLRTAEDNLDFIRTQQLGARMEIDRETLDVAAENLLGAEDAMYGGFGNAPKFPQAPLVTFLTEYARLTHDERPARAAIRAVLAMLRGGTYDQAGGGLFRYSTDEQWLVPHFEKMLYDQAGLLSSLAMLAPFASKDEAVEFAHYARATTNFLDAALARPNGGYYSSLDAETGGVEGATYVWTYDELAELLTPEQLGVAEEFLGVTPAGNWEHSATILTRRAGRAAEGDRSGQVDSILRAIAAARSQRPQPAVIDNVIVSWNALAARGLIEAGVAFEDMHLVRRGMACLDWLLAASVKRNGEVIHAVTDGGSDDIRFLEDAAAVTAALIAADRATDTPGLLDRARKIHELAFKKFATSEGFVMSIGDTGLPLPMLDTDDSATPSGASLLAENALALVSARNRTVGIDAAEQALSQCGRTARVVPVLAGAALAMQARILGKGNTPD